MPQKPAFFQGQRQDVAVELADLCEFLVSPLLKRAEVLQNRGLVLQHVEYSPTQFAITCKFAKKSILSPGFLMEIIPAAAPGNISIFKIFYFFILNLGLVLTTYP